METDDALMRRVRNGDDDAFREIVDRHRDSLVNYVTHLVRSRDRAEEIAQESFVRLFQHAARYRENDRLKPYLFQIATNLVVSEIRREARWRLLMPRLVSAVPPSSEPADAPVIAGEIQRQVARALERLPVKYRAPLVLFEIEEWSYDAIGKALNLRCGTVKSRISRARDLLRRQLAPWWTGGKHHERESADEIAAGSAAHERVAGIHL